jgi:hypothetical protein
MSYEALLIAGTLMASITVIVAQYRWIDASEETHRLERLRAVLHLAGIMIAFLLLLPLAREADEPPEQPCCLRTLPAS